MQPAAAILSRYEGDRWLSGLLSGEHLQAVLDWIARTDSNPPVPPGASGKPLAWLVLLDGSIDSNPQVLRRIGLLTDVYRTIEHQLSAQDLEQLEAIFQRHGQPLDHASGDTPPFC